MRFCQLFYKTYPITIPLYLLLISILYVQFNNSLIISIAGFIPLLLAHPDPVLLFKEILSHLGIKNKKTSAYDQYPEYKNSVEEILKEHNLNFDVKIINSESINAFYGFSTITITKGFMNAYPLNNNQDKLKILPLLGHEITHKKREKAFIKELILYLIAFTGVFVLAYILA